jgi:hypothetical protein
MIVPLRIFCGEPSHHGRPLVGDRQEDRPADSPTPFIALTRWIDLFVDFLVTKHGLAEALRSDNAAFEPLHA